MLWITITACVLFAWYRDHMRLQAEIYRIQSSRSMWSSAQVLGPPDTNSMGDIGTAWASATQDGQAEWLLLDYGSKVAGAELHIFETYNPGAVNRVSVVSNDGVETELWSGKDPYQIENGIALSSIPISGSVRRVKIYLDSVAVPGWNEIDAVGLVDVSGKVHWPVKAKASSSFSSGGFSADYWAF